MDQLQEYVQYLLREKFGLTVAATAVASVGILAFYLASRNKAPAIKYAVSAEDQSVEVEPGVRTSRMAPNGKLIDYFYPDAVTTHEAFKRGLGVSNGGPCLGSPSGPNYSYQWISYQEVYDRAQAFGSALVKRGVNANTESFVGIYASNCTQWVVAEQACGMYSMVVVPLYDTLGAQACSYIINQTGMKIVVVDKTAKALALVQNADETPSVQYIVVMEGLSDDLEAAATDQSVTVLAFDDLLEEGKKNIVPLVPPTPDDVCTICYTSGTTGNPKGVLLTHKNMMANTASVLMACPNAMTMSVEDIHISYLPLAHMFEQIVQNLSINSSDIHISYLPLAHMFECITQLMMLQHGARIGFSRGDVRFLTNDLQTLRPTIFPTVPRLINRMYDKVMQGVSGSWLKSKLFNIALSRKTALLQRGIITKDSIWDRLVFGKVQKLLGGRVRFVVTGSAPLAANVLTFARCAFGCMVFEGYGQTEATAAVSFTLENDFAAGHAGCPVPCNYVKLADVPDMEYYAKDNKGEVCVKGSNVMLGYYKEPEKTADTIDVDGWLHTGDIGEWLPNGSLKIIDRKKHLFKLAQGEYIAPEKIEAVYLRCPLIAQAFVDGSSLETYAVGVFVPDPDVIPRWAANNGMSGDMAALCKNQKVKQAIMDELTKSAKAAGLKGFEQVKQIYLESEMFSAENGLLTPTFKSKRPALRKHYQEQIHEMYNKN